MAPKSTALPKNWPPATPYLTTPTYSPTLTSAHLTTIHTRSTDAQDIPPNTPKGPSSLVKIVPLPPGSEHPAAGQAGLFATRDLKPGTFILQYIGEVHDSSSDKHKDSDYDLSLDRLLGIGIDAAKKGNEARFINDYRGVPGVEKANAEFKEIWDAARKERGMGVWVLAEGKGKNAGKSKGIRKGEEILVSYGRGFWGARKSVEGEDEA